MTSGDSGADRGGIKKDALSNMVNHFTDFQLTKNLMEQISIR